MQDIQYKVAVSKKVTAYCGKTRLSELALEEWPSLDARRQLRQAVGSEWVKAAWLMTGRRCLPADLNELLDYKKVVEQVMADSPRLLPCILGAVREGVLKATPTHTLVKRFKGMLRQEGLSAWQARPSVRETTKKAPGVVAFWRNHKDSEPLTEAGWRYLVTLPIAVLRQYFGDSYDMVRQVALLNRLSALDIPGIPAVAFGFATKVVQRGWLAPEHEKALLLAMRETGALSASMVAQQVGLLEDWLRGEKPAIQPNTRWNTLVVRATDYALVQAELNRLELEKLRWTSPIPPFVTTDGLVVRPLVKGTDLLDEGHTMANCLRNTRFFAQDALVGKSLVFSISGVAGRATVEFTRSARDKPWSLHQAEEAANQPVRVAELMRAVQQLNDKMKEVA